MDQPRHGNPMQNQGNGWSAPSPMNSGHPRGGMGYGGRGGGGRSGGYMGGPQRGGPRGRGGYGGGPPRGFQGGGRGGFGGDRGGFGGGRGYGGRGGGGGFGGPPGRGFRGRGRGRPAPTNIVKKRKAYQGAQPKKNFDNGATDELKAKKIAEEKYKYAASLHPVSRLGEIQQAAKGPQPIYNCTAERILPKNEKEFVIQCAIGETNAEGVGSNKKNAKKNSAMNMLKLMGYTIDNAQEGSNTQNGVNGVEQPKVDGDSPQVVPAPKSISQPATQSQLTQKITAIKMTPSFARPATQYTNPAEHIPQTPAAILQGGTGITNPTARAHTDFSNPTLKPAAPKPISMSHSGPMPMTRSTNLTGSTTLPNTATPTPSPAESLKKDVADASSNQLSLGLFAKSQLEHMASQRGFNVSFSNFPQKDKFFCLLSIDTKPPLVAHGDGMSLVEAQMDASRKALKEFITKELV